MTESGFQFPAQDWRADIYAALKRQRIAQVGYVPDAGHATLIQALHAANHVRTLFTSVGNEADRVGPT